MDCRTPGTNAAPGKRATDNSTICYRCERAAQKEVYVCLRGLRVGKIKMGFGSVGGAIIVIGLIIHVKRY